MKRVFTLTLALSFLLTGCITSTQVEPSPPPTPQATATPIPATPAPTTITVTDHLDRTVTLDAPADTIVSGYYIATSYLLALGLEDRLVGIEAKADTRNIYQLSAPQIIDLPSVGSLKSFNVESCANLNPDLIIMSVRSKESVEQLEALGLTVIAVNPESPELVEDTVSLIAKVTGSEEEGEALLTYLQETQEQVDTLIQDCEPVQVYLAGGDTVLNTAGPKMYQHHQLVAAGGINVAQEIEDSYWANISYEHLLSYNPEVIVILPDADYDVADVLADENLSMLDCIQNQQVYKMPNDVESFDAPTPSSSMGVLFYVSTLYPDVLPTSQFQSAMTEFYATFFGIDV